MYAQVAQYHGPRSKELVAAGMHAGRDRILPAIEADPQMQQEMVSLLVLVAADGGELVIPVTRTMAGIQRATEVIRNTALLPDEDPALLSEPDRIDIYEVVDARAYAAAVPS
ncbi:MAG: hypothetical protein ACRDVG_13915 [Jatrophihabitantaceae bacterium]